MTITVFSSSNCAVCHSLMQWLDQQHVTYDNVVIDESEDGMAKMMAATGGTIQGTPLTLIEDGDKSQTVAGFDRVKLQTLLGLV